jgi:hypothetical protein
VVLLSLAVVVLGGVVAAWTFEPAVAAGISLVHAAASLDPSVVVPVEFAAMIVFFVAFSGATRALDRLVVGGVRAVIVD